MMELLRAIGRVALVGPVEVVTLAGLFLYLLETVCAANFQ
jgi:hypothetical protein